MLAREALGRTIRAIGLVAAVACRDEIPNIEVGPATAGMSSLPTLAGIRLGMTADEVRRRAPGAVDNPYVGLFQRRKGVGYNYWFRSVAAAQVPGTARLNSVMAVRTFREDSLARAEYRRARSALERRLGVRGRCFAFAIGTDSTTGIEFVTDSIVLRVVWRPASGDSVSSATTEWISLDTLQVAHRPCD
jgi:hypothetical protein